VFFLRAVLADLNAPSHLPKGSTFNLSFFNFSPNLAENHSVNLQKAVDSLPFLHLQIDPPFSVGYEGAFHFDFNW